jgi:hypothetical protein
VLPGDTAVWLHCPLGSHVSTVQSFLSSQVTQAAPPMPQDRADLTGSQVVPFRTQPTQQEPPTQIPFAAPSEHGAPVGQGPVAPPSTEESAGLPPSGTGRSTQPPLRAPADTSHRYPEPHVASTDAQLRSMHVLPAPQLVSVAQLKPDALRRQLARSSGVSARVSLGSARREGASRRLPHFAADRRLPRETHRRKRHRRARRPVVIEVVIGPRNNNGRWRERRCRVTAS